MIRINIFRKRQIVIFVSTHYLIDNYQFVNIYYNWINLSCFRIKKKSSLINSATGYLILLEVSKQS
jgi:hypothetical protein